MIELENYRAYLADKIDRLNDDIRICSHQTSIKKLIEKRRCLYESLYELDTYMQNNEYI